MPPHYGIPDYDFPTEIHSDNPKGNDDGSATQMAMWYFLVLILIIVIWLILYFILRLLTLRQKTRNPQQRRAYMGSRSQTSIPASEPTIYVSPANLPPPPKYEAMAPPSYEEVVGIHYPGYQPPGQPINQPITAALAIHNNTSTNTTNSSNADTNVANNSNTATNISHTVVNSLTTITTVDERRPVAALS